MKRFVSIISLILVCFGTPVGGMEIKSTGIVQEPVGLIFSEECGDIEKVSAALKDNTKFHHMLNGSDRLFPREQFIIAANTLRKIITENLTNQTICENGGEILYSLICNFESFYTQNSINSALITSILSREDLKFTGDFLESLIAQWNKVKSGQSIKKKEKALIVGLFKRIVDYTLDDALCNTFLKEATSVDNLENFFITGTCSACADYRSLSFSPQLLKAILNTQYQRIMEDQAISARKTISAQKKALYNTLVKKMLIDELDSLSAMLRMQNSTLHENIVALAKHNHEKLALYHILTTAQARGDSDLLSNVASYIEEKQDIKDVLTKLILSVAHNKETQRAIIQACIRKTTEGTEKESSQKPLQDVKANETDSPRTLASEVLAELPQNRLVAELHREKSEFFLDEDSSASEADNVYRTIVQSKKLNDQLVGKTQIGLRAALENMMILNTASKKHTSWKPALFTTGVVAGLGAACWYQWTALKTFTARHMRESIANIFARFRKAAA